MQVGGVIFVGLGDGGLVEDGESGADVEFFRGLEAEAAGGVGRSVFAVEERDDGEDEAAVGKLADVEDGGEIDGAGEFDVESGEEQALEVGHVFLLGGEDEFEEEVRVVGGAGEGDDAAGEEVARSEAEGAHDVVGTGGVGDEVFGVGVVAEVVAQEEVVGLGQLARGYGAEAFEQFFGVEELAARGAGQFEAFGRVDFIDGAQQAVAEAFFRMTEDVEAADPTQDGKAGEEDDENGPSEKVVLSASGQSADAALIHRAAGVLRRALSRGGCACIRRQCL